MKRIAVVAAAVALSASLFADEASKVAKIHELFQLTHADQMQKQIMQQCRTMVSTQLAGSLPKNVPPEVSQQIAQDTDHMIAVIADRVSWAKMEAQITQIYAGTFSEEEIDGILGFYKSPAGQAFLDKMPVLMSKTMTVAQQSMQGIMPEIERMSTEMAEKFAHQAQPDGGTKH